MLRRLLIGLSVVVVAATLAPAAGATAAPTASSTANAVPGGLTPDGRTLHAGPGGHVRAVAAVGDCEQDNVTCKPDLSGSCTGNTSQSTPPTSIRVLTGSTASSIKTVDFRTYVEDVLPNEWLASWDGDALKAGAVAVKSYAWYWATHYGGYVGSTASSSTCFDVTDDPDFQVYEPGTGSVNDRIVRLVGQSWPVAVRRDGDVVQTYYRSYLTDAGEKEACGAGSDGTTMSQYGTEACNKVNNRDNGYRYNVILRLYYGDDIDLTTTTQQRTPHDFNFTAKSTGGSLAAGNWTIADGYPTTFRFGTTGDLPVISDDGDGFATTGVYRPSSSTFYLTDALRQQTTTVPFGQHGDMPVPAHYNGLDAPTQLGVFRPSNGTWYLADGRAVAKATVFGTSGDVPVPGRWLNASADSIAVFRPSTARWYVPGAATVAWGGKGDIAAPADYTGDGRTDIAVYRPSNHTFYVRGRQPVAYGTTGDVPVTGDFDGDGKADLAVYRPSTGVLYVYGQASRDVGRGTPIGAAPFRG